MLGLLLVLPYKLQVVEGCFCQLTSGVEAVKMAMEFPKDFNPYVDTPVNPRRGEVLPEFAQSWEPFRILWQIVLEFVQMECYNISDPGALSLESVKPQAVENPLVESWCPYYSQKYEFSWTKVGALIRDMICFIRLELSCGAIRSGCAIKLFPVAATFFSVNYGFICRFISYLVLLKIYI